MHESIFSTKFLDNKLRNDTLDHVKDLEHKQLILKRWISAIENDSINWSNETQIDITFLNDIFGEVLDYEYLIDKSQVNLLPKQNIESKEPDAILGYFSREKNLAGFENQQTLQRDIKAVVELKDSRTDLDRIQNRVEKISPVTQAFEYARKAGINCKWIIVSNFRTIRLYNKESDKYEIFNIADLNDNYQLKRFFYFLHKDRLIFTAGESPVDAMYRERQEEEVRITNEFYNKFKDIRLLLFEHLQKNNPQIDKLICLEKAQKLLDRIIFICFCADLEILPPKILQNIKLDSNKAYYFSDNILWRNLIEFFSSVDKGNTRIAKLNGGLFAKDEVLNSLEIKDKTLNYVFELAEYDYRSDLNVNILGHIFEQSISDLEKIKKQIVNPQGINPQGFQNLAGLESATNGKRKEFGIFYTPDYITNYIVHESIGNWLAESRKQLGESELPLLTDKDYDSIKTTKQGTLKTNDKIEKHKKYWTDYQQKLLSIKVLDPACGSGAFLVAAFDYLLKEYLVIQKELKLLNPAVPHEKFLPKAKGGLEFTTTELFDIEDHIIKKCLFGVDINFESIEITKLALWLKTVKRGKILSDIDYNIQQGNSLIDNIEIANKVAFNWNEKFRSIMQNGGFDVVIGNPPYISFQNNYFTKLEIDFFNKTYNTVYKIFDAFALFIEKGMQLINNEGVLSYICPSVFLTNDSFSKLRNYLINNGKIISILNCGDNVFPDAVVPTICFTFQRNATQKLHVDLYNIDNNNKIYLENKIDINLFNKIDSVFNLRIHLFDSKLLEKISISCLPLGDLLEIRESIKTGNDAEFINDSKLNDNYLPVISGKDISRYYLNSKRFINFDSEKLNRPTKLEYYNQNKLFIRRVGSNLCATFDNANHLSTHVLYLGLPKNIEFNLKYLLSLLNSKLFNYIYNLKYPAKGAVFPEIRIGHLRELPIKNIPIINQQILIEKADLILNKTNEFNELNNKFLTFCQSQFPFEKLTERLKEWYLLNFKEFTKELRRQKVKMDLNKLYKLYDFIDIFEQEKRKIIEIKQLINNCDAEIDKIIYQLYNLDEKEIGIIESFK